MKMLFSVLTSLLLTSVSYAQETKTVVAPSDAAAPVAATSTLEATPALTGWQAPKFGPFKLSAGLKSTTNSGRVVDLEDKEGRQYKSKLEYYVGMTHDSGWGLSALAVTSGTTYREEAKKETSYVAADPSLTLAHPTVYESADVKITGQLRSYFPVSISSKALDRRQYAYYMYTTYKMSGGWTLWNQLTPRYFFQNRYADTDTTSYVEDWTTLTKKVSPSFKYGFGQRAQMEWHKETVPGSVMEVFPLA
ncbi:MAG: hypothetical protein AB7O96_10775, partial [Pseudobdellovibrionaceae bacterium]